MNLNQTNGLLAGPFVSRLISEALLTRIDKEIKSENIRFVRYVDDYEISTHAFTEGDGSWSPDLMPVTDFNSRLHGRRHGNAYVFIHSKVFQLTPSRKATANSNNFCC